MIVSRRSAYESGVFTMPRVNHYQSVVKRHSSSMMITDRYTTVLSRHPNSRLHSLDGSSPLATVMKDAVKQRLSWNSCAVRHPKQPHHATMIGSVYPDLDVRRRANVARAGSMWAWTEMTGGVHVGRWLVKTNHQMDTSFPTGENFTGRKKNNPQNPVYVHSPGPIHIAVPHSRLRTSICQTQADGVAHMPSHYRHRLRIHTNLQYEASRSYLILVFVGHGRPLRTTYSRSLTPGRGRLSRVAVPLWNLSQYESLDFNGREAPIADSCQLTERMPRRESLEEGKDSRDTLPRPSNPMCLPLLRIPSQRKARQEVDWKHLIAKSTDQAHILDGLLIAPNTARVGAKTTLPKQSRCSNSSENLRTAPRPSLLRELYAVLNQIGRLSRIDSIGFCRTPSNAERTSSTPYTTPYTCNFGRSLRHNHVPDHFYHLLTDQVVQDSSATDTSNLENSILLVTTSSRSRALSKKSQTLASQPSKSTEEGGVNLNRPFIHAPRGLGIIFRCKLMYKKKLIIPPFSHSCHAITITIIIPPHPHNSNSTFSHNHPNSSPPPTQHQHNQTAKMRAAFAIVSLLAATVAARFDGPCTDTVCGDSRVNCEAEGRICVGFPSNDFQFLPTHGTCALEAAASSSRTLMANSIPIRSAFERSPILERLGVFGKDTGTRNKTHHSRETHHEMAKHTKALGEKRWNPHGMISKPEQKNSIEKIPHTTSSCPQHNTSLPFPPKVHDATHDRPSAVTPQTRFEALVSRSQDTSTSPPPPQLPPSHPFSYPFAIHAHIPPFKQTHPSPTPQKLPRAPRSHRIGILPIPAYPRDPTHPRDPNTRSSKPTLPRSIGTGIKTHFSARHFTVGKPAHGTAKALTEYCLSSLTPPLLRKGYIRDRSLYRYLNRISLATCNYSIAITIPYYDYRLGITATGIQDSIQRRKKFPFTAPHTDRDTSSMPRVETRNPIQMCKH
ncbi:uncharacterized protein CLUP02_15602 [Colletotrichum lupini]|uniref:Uncharacterized protein n=1 Tax=Colletotrichum lupini TaxID=145971 RepID=A0A9Q8T8M8_9PEZI|nr:uncharacterized protein CLUP02_15602 [Colletotrichum lupini]UQC90071.1 hypothetical protein CLUP02_15602 [Colletotrichum lupini]